MWNIVYTKQAQKDTSKLAAAGLRKKAEMLLEVLQENPYRNPPRFEKLVGDLSGTYSRRINVQHRLVYEVEPGQQVVKVLRMWSHYD